MSADLPAGPAWLFVPAVRPDRVVKAAGLADVVVIDCEDSVPTGAKAEARAGLAELAARLDRRRLVVRVNALDSDDGQRDLAAVRAAGLGAVMVPKAEHPGLLEGVGLSVVALCETPRGILAAAEIAAAVEVVGLMWGSADLSAALGAHNGHEVLAHARWQVLLAARASGVVAIDHVVPTVSVEPVVTDAAVAARNGFDAKACIHPGQVELIRHAFAPTAEQIAWAEQVLAAESGASRLGGQLVDEAVRKQARRILRDQMR